jgi:gas vesicle protein
MSQMSPQASPEELEQDIERTRAELRENVDALQEKLSPTAAAKRGANRVQEAVAQVKDTVMGTAEEGVAKTQEGVAHAQGTVSDQVSRRAESVRETGRRVQRTTRGNPLAVGLGAFALGWLVSSLLPVSRREREAIESIQESDAASAIKEPLVESARTVVQSAGDRAKEGVAEVGAEAQQAAAQVADHAKDAAAQTKDDATEVAHQAS